MRVRLDRLAWVTLTVNLLVILWGAWVRASGSGAGCGNHWPNCNGSMVPHDPSIKTLIEFTHRLSTPLVVVLVVSMVWIAWRRYPRGHAVRASSAASLVLLVIEALIGATLVKFNLVADNPSPARAVVLGIHLVNTQFLLAAIALTGWWAGPVEAWSSRALGGLRRSFAVVFVLLILVGMTGAIASLGDTLFPASTLQEGIAQDRDPTSNLLLHLRVWHPVLAIATGVMALALASWCMRHDARVRVRRAAERVSAIVIVQWCVGALSLILLVPIALQLLHLLVADLVWLSMVGLLVHCGDQAALSSATTNADASTSNTVPAPLSR